jgi:hypothetical protein
VDSFGGTIYAPHAALTFTGSGYPFLIDSQIIAYTVNITGCGGINLAYDADHNFKIPSSAMVQLVK